MGIKNEGGDRYARLIGSEEYYLPTVVSPLTMLSSKEKRKTRRQIQERENYSRGMDILPFIPKTDNQENLWTSLNKNTVTIAVGAAGVGKTLVGLWWGLEQVARGQLEKVYYVRSDVGCSWQRQRGALPGTMEEKMRPLVGPVHDNLLVIARSKGAADYLISKEIIHPMLLEDVRGRSFNECLIIFDEAQNTMPEHIKTVLTRVGSGSKVLITGDTKQIDLDAFKPDNGLIDCYKRLSDIKGVGRVRFSLEDIVRNGIIADILEAYEC
jgi:phosphate starvation-inducible PhoH-like protein